MSEHALISTLTCLTLLGSRMQPWQINSSPPQTAAAPACSHLLHCCSVAGQQLWPSWAQHSGAKSSPQRSEVGLQCRAIGSCTGGND